MLITSVLSRLSVEALLALPVLLVTDLPLAGGVSAATGVAGVTSATAGLAAGVVAALTEAGVEAALAGTGVDTAFAGAGVEVTGLLFDATGVDAALPCNSNISVYV